MGEFDNNGTDNGQTYETVENPQVVEESGSYNSTQTESTTTYYTEPQNESKVFAIISLVCGIVSLLCSCCGWLSIILGVAAVVLGILSINKQENAKGMAIAGIICGGVGIVIAIVIIIMGAALNSVDPSELENVIENLDNL